AAGLLLAAAAPARADMIFLKDGFVLVGKLRQEKVQIVDPYTKKTDTVSRGFMFVDNGPRRYYFSPVHVQDTDAAFVRPEDTVSNFRRIILPPNTGRMPVIVEVVEAPDFDKSWTRTLKYNTTTYSLAVPQRLQVLNSFYAQVDATKHFLWSSYYLTDELG